MDEPSTPQLLERLLNALAEELPAGPPIAPVSGDGPFLFDFEVDAQPVRLLSIPGQSPACLTVTSPLGPVPEDDGQAETALRQLLRLSHLSAGSGASVGYEPDERCLYLMQVLPLATTSAPELASAMHRLARMAVRWRDDPLLGAPPRPRADRDAPGLRA